MGYTHYWTQKRDFTLAEWADICTDLGEIIKEAQHNQGIPLGNGNGDPGTSPQITRDHIFLNGVGDDSHETFCVYRVRPPKEQWQTTRGTDLCKTARKPYDPVVTAALCYLSTITRKDDPNTGSPIIDSESHSVSSDGYTSDFLMGLELARQALPRKANLLDYPMGLMRDDRWCGPWVDAYTTGSWSGGAPGHGYEVRFCVDGHGYVLKGKHSYRFATHQGLAQFLERNKQTKFSPGGHTGFGGYPAIEPNIWNASGSFDTTRHARLTKAQAKVLRQLFPVPADHAHQPPLYVRPGDMPPNGGREFCYSLSDLLNLAA